MKQNRIHRLTVTAVLAALALVLSLLEHWLPPLPVPGAHLGLANMVVMYALASLSFPYAAGITAVKAVYALFRGPVAFMMCTSGSVLALLVMAVAQRFLSRWMSFIGIGIIGAAAHNIGQLLVSVCLLGRAMWYYTPVFLFLAIPTGALTGCMLNILFPHLREIWSYERT